MMWREKLQTIRESSPGNITLAMFSTLTRTGAPTELVEDVKRRWPFLPASYIDLLRMTDGVQLDLFVLYGSGRSPLPSLIERNESRMRHIDTVTNVAIGEDGDGGVIVLSSDGSIHVYRFDPPSDPKTIADSFDTLMNEVIMGPKYMSYFPTGRRHTDWIDFLMDQKWV